MADKTILDFVDQNTLIGNDEIPFLRVLSGKYSRISYAEMLTDILGNVSGTVPEATDVTASTASTNIDFLQNNVFRINITSDTAINAVATGGAQFIDRQIYYLILNPNPATKTVSFNAVFSSDAIAVSKPTLMIFLADGTTKLVPISASGSGSSETHNVVTATELDEIDSPYLYQKVTALDTGLEYVYLINGWFQNHQTITVTSSQTYTNVALEDIPKQRIALWSSSGDQMHGADVTKVTGDTVIDFGRVITKTFSIEIK